MSIYLKEFEKFVENGVVYLPIGTLEWHGNQLPIETDFLVAEKLCQIIAKDFPGYVMPSLYLATCSAETVDGKELRGMDRKLKKELPGNLFFLKPELLKEVLEAMVCSLRQQGFNKIIIITGHGGDSQIGTLEEFTKDKSDILFINPYDATDVDIHHADEGETSLFWACYPEEEAKSKVQNIPEDDDLTKYRGYSPRDKASLELGKKYLQQMIEYSKEKIKSFIG